MPIYSGRDIRNILVLGHSGCGKTTVAEALACNAGAVPRMGTVDDGTTISDYNDDEKERKCSISSALLSFTCGNKKINLLDTPGYIDFIGETIGGLRAMDCVVIVVNATGGVEIGTERAWKLSREKAAPVVIFINRMDKEHADFEKCVDAVKKKFGTSCAVVNYPVGREASFKSVVDLMSPASISKLSGDDAAAAKAIYESMCESVAESDDALLEKYLEKGELTEAELKESFKAALLAGKVAPILCGAAAKNIGVKELLELITNQLPSPLEMPLPQAANADTGEPVPIEAKPDSPLGGLVFKTLSDPYLGQISMIRIFSGKLASNSGFYNTSKRAREKTGQLFSLLGKSQTSVEEAGAGDIVCVAKLKDTVTGDSVSDDKANIKFADIAFPEPALSFSIRPKTRSDEDKISGALHKLTAEDPTFRAVRDEQTKELVASGMGDMHINIMINRMKMRYGVGVDVGTPKVAYKETILANGDSQYRHKKQTGGAGQFAEVWMRIEPLERGTGFEFVDEVVGGAIPKPFVVSCEKGVKTALQNGALAGYPVVDVKVVVYDGKTHPVDSKDIAFQIAARHAFRESFLKAKPVLLEPIMNVDVIVPDEFMGDITGSLNSRRGRIMGMEPGDGVQVIKAMVPLEEMYKYVNELKSITGGRGTYNMTFSHYEVVPSNLAQTIVERAKATRQEEKEE
jgi:elongation factor G